MTTSLLLDNLDCSSDSEDIHRLFPKCRRPQQRADVNLNNSIHDSNDNRIMLQSVSGTSPPPPPSSTSPIQPPAILASVAVQGEQQLLVEAPPPPLTLLCNVNGCERHDADDEEEDEPEEPEDLEDESLEGSQRGGDSTPPSGPPPPPHEDLLNGGGSYTRKYNKHLRDSRIEIAGGREVFSQSKSKAARKRYSDDGSAAVAAAAAAVGTVGSLAGPPRRNDDNPAGVWELRGTAREKSKRTRNVCETNNAVSAQPPLPVQPSVEMVTETVFSSEVRSIRRLSSAAPAQPVVYEVPVVAGAGGTDVVVFDDIGECLAEQHLQRSRRSQSQPHTQSQPQNQQSQHHQQVHHSHSGPEDDSASAGSSSTGRDTPPSFHHRPPADFFKVLAPSGSDGDTDVVSPERSRAPRIIGGLPIAEYEGSPRRYGPRPPEPPGSPLLSGVLAPNLPSAQSLLSSPSAFPPRPGFPKRVVQAPQPPPQDSSPQPVTEPTPSQHLTSNTLESISAAGAYDYLYEFSETRKVLEEFFKPSSPPLTQADLTEGCGVDFHELDYNLHRQAGNSYVGQRLAKDGASPGVSEDRPSDDHEPSSPPRVHKAAGGTPDLISLRDTDDAASSFIAAIAERLSPDPVLGEPNFLAPPPDPQELETAATNPVDEPLPETEAGTHVGHSRNFTLSPETTDCDSNDIESEVSLENEGSMHSSGGGRLYGSMPVLEDGLSSGHVSDAEDCSIPISSSMVQPPSGEANPTVLLMKKQICEIEREIRSRAHKHDTSKTGASSANGTMSQQDLDFRAVEDFLRGHNVVSFSSEVQELDVLGSHRQDPPPPPAPQPHRSDAYSGDLGVATESVEAAIKDIRMALQRTKALPLRSPTAAVNASGVVGERCGSPVWVPRYDPMVTRLTSSSPPPPPSSIDMAPSPPIVRRHHPPPPPQPPPPGIAVPVRSLVNPVVSNPMVERKITQGPSSDDAADEEELDTDLETDRLLGQQRTDDQGFFDDKEWRRPKLRTVLPSGNNTSKLSSSSSNKQQQQQQPQPPPLPPQQQQQLPSSVSQTSAMHPSSVTVAVSSQTISSSSSSSASSTSSGVGNNTASSVIPPGVLDSNNITDKTPPSPQKNIINNINNNNAATASQQPVVTSSTAAASSTKQKKEKDGTKKKGRNKEAIMRDPSVLIEGVLFRARYLGSTQLVCEGQPTKTTRMMQAEEAVSRIKANQNCSVNSRGVGGGGGVFSSGGIVMGDEAGQDDGGAEGGGGGGGGGSQGSAAVRTIQVQVHPHPQQAPSQQQQQQQQLLEEEAAAAAAVLDLDDDEDMGEEEVESEDCMEELDDEDLEEEEEEEEEVEEEVDIRGHVNNKLRVNKTVSSMVAVTPAPPPPSSGGAPILPSNTKQVGGATAFRLHFLGSIEVEEEGKKHRKRLKKNMVEEAVTRVKAPEGENQPSTEVDLFISTEKIMVLNTDLKEIMMDHALRTISYIADIGDLVVLMARRRYVPQDVEEAPKINRTPKMICHVFESDEAQFIAQSIGQAFQVAYMEFLKANGIEDHSFVKEMDYQEVLNSQEIFGDELQMFAKKEMQKEVVVPKAKGEILGVVIVESGWGSMLPTVVIANLAPAGAAARCGQLNIGDQIIAINGVSLVGLPLSTCQNYIKNSKNQTVVKLTVVPCAPVVEVKIKRPDTKYQLGFSVQNGVICSLLRGGIAERGGVRVGHRIIEINNQSVVAVPHEKIVNLLATSVGEILMKTMPTSMFRLLTGQETPVYI